MNYSEKLKSPKWQKKRLEVLSRDNFTCCKCDDTETELHVHHLKYNGEPHEAELSDLETLCKHCHYFFTFYEKSIYDDYGVKGVKKILKTNLAYTILVEDTIFLFMICDGKLELHICFDKNSNALKNLIKLSKL